jgi:heat shock protein HslJ
MVSVFAGFLYLALVIAPVAPGTPTATESSIPPVVWELVSLSGANGFHADIEDSSQYTLQFLPEGRMAAKLDCNQGGAGFSASDGALEIGQMMSTLALCDVDSNGHNYQVILQSATKYAFDPDGFLLLSGGEGNLKLRATLPGVSWEWTEFAGGDGEIVRPEAPGQYTVEFLPAGKLAIQADCNRAMGSYTVDVDGSVIDLQVGGVTRAMCPPGSLMDRFLRDLDDSSSFVFREGRLYLALPMDGGILEFVPTYVEPPATPAAG